MNFPFLKQVNKLVAFIKGKSYTITSEDQNYAAVLEAINAEAGEEEVLVIIDKKVEVQKAIKHLGFFFDENDELTYNDKKLHEEVSLVVKSFSELYGGFDNEEMSSLRLFIDNLVQNPDYEAMDDLFSFLQKGNLPITDDGHFLAYKMVRSDFKDIYSGTLDNSPGKTVEMSRERCNLNRHETCSTGLHFCSESYIGGFGGSDSKLIEVKINPKDVTSIPVDYNQAKGRCCKYLVTREIIKGELSETKIVETVEESKAELEELPELPNEKEVDTEVVIEKTNTPISIGTKKCSKCNEVKKLEDFGKRKDSKDGYKGVCKECTNRQAKERKRRK